MQTLEILNRTLSISHQRLDRVQIPGVHVLPRILSKVQIRKIIGLKELKCHHDDGGHGHGDVGHGGSPTEPEKKKPKKQESDKDQKSGIHHFRADKPHRLPWVADLIYQYVPHLRIGTRRSCAVDEYMQLYRLQEGGGVVPQHVDEDFEGPGGSPALCSIILYLSRGYTGGETVFNGNMLAPHAEVGGGLLFRHDVPHEGLAVMSGEKYVLKTDLLFR